MQGKIKKNIFESVFDLARIIKKRLFFIPYLGTGRWCPVCEKSSRKFREYGDASREDALCMYCGALERHRFAWLYLKTKTNLFDGKAKKMLHVAPERCFEPGLRNLLGGDYITADLLSSQAMVRMDITDIRYPDGYFDVVYCSHVLEHVQDDKRALREFYRILKQDGWAILLVPITAERTVEDPSIVELSDRLKIFGQEDHVRCYGPDYVERLYEAGFKVKVELVSNLFKKNEIELMGLTQSSGEIYYCTK